MKKKYLVEIYDHTRADFVPNEGYTAHHYLYCGIERFLADTLDDIRRYIADNVLQSYQPDPLKLDVDQMDNDRPNEYVLLAGCQDHGEDYIEDVYFTVSTISPVADLLAI